MTKSKDSNTMRNPPATGFGMASTTARNFGRNATAMKAAPTTTPTVRAATPVISVTAMLVE